MKAKRRVRRFCGARVAMTLGYGWDAVGFEELSCRWPTGWIGEPDAPHIGPHEWQTFATDKKTKLTVSWENLDA